ncbi:TerB family tellurite resistance protein [Massilia glaciei]|uniref:TerB family tellurite resistance protein n=1 Tax=Massilia glaciei TaxID=1524097 RepID=UPI001E37111A|nr:TerB family tellurite resistance protein [Massilia glaciei]
MRAYEIDSPHAAGRILALMMVSDGNLAQSELAAMNRSGILNYVDLDDGAFQQLLQDLCQDLLTSATHGFVQIDNAMVDHLLQEIAHPDMRRQLLKAMWQIADADGWLADGEAVLLTRASAVWGAESGFGARAIGG